MMSFWIFKYRRNMVRVGIGEVILFAAQTWLSVFPKLKSGAVSIIKPQKPGAIYQFKRDT